jgi:hypothetical protein
MGSELMEKGLQMDLAGKPAAVVVTYQRMD